MSLEKELAGVIVSEIESPNNLIDINSADEAVVGAADDQHSVTSDDAVTTKDSDDDKSTERPVENVRRELLRKQTESEQRIMAQVSQLGDMIKTTLGAISPGKKPAQSLDDLTLDELRVMRGQVPEDKKAEFDAYFEDRRIEKSISEKVTRLDEESKYQTERDGANKLAVDKYPQLKDRYSELHQEVNRRLASLDQNRIKYNPRIILNLADDVAGELGIAPRYTNRARTITQPPSTRGTKPMKTEETEQTSLFSDEAFDTLSKRYAHTLKGGRKFDKARIKERSKEYQKHLFGDKE